MELLTFSPCREGNPAAVPGNSPVKVTLIIYWRSAKSGREPARVFFCVRERAFVCLLEEPLNGGGRSFTNIGFTHWKQPPVNLLPSPPPPTHTHGEFSGRYRCRHIPLLGKETHTLFWILFLWILMPELIFFQALLSGSLRIFSFGDERLRRWAECIHKVS